MRIRSQNHVVKQSHTHKLASLFNLCCHFNITTRRIQISWRMIMRNDNPRSIAKQSRLHHYPDIYQCRWNPALRYFLNPKNLIRLVQIERKKRFPVIYFLRIKMFPENIHRIQWWRNRPFTISLSWIAQFNFVNNIKIHFVCSEYGGDLYFPHLPSKTWW